MSHLEINLGQITIRFHLFMISSIVSPTITFLGFFSGISNSEFASCSDTPNVDIKSGIGETKFGLEVLALESGISAAAIPELIIQDFDQSMKLDAEFLSESDLENPSEKIKVLLGRPSNLSLRRKPFPEHRSLSLF